MRILIIGADGFIGRNLVAHLGNGGHRIVCGGRDPERLAHHFPGCEVLVCDFMTDRAQDWLPRLTGIDAVVNAAGIVRGTPGNAFTQIHAAGPCALFDACAQAGIPRLIQISALGADATSWSQFHRSKLVADNYLCELADRQDRDGWLVLRPAVVIGRGGHSTALFAAIAALPYPLRIGRGAWAVPAIHIDDLTQAVALLLDAKYQLPRKADLLAPDTLTTDGLTLLLRRWLGLPDRPMLPIPEFALRAGAWMGDRLGIGILTGEMLGMLRSGHAPDPCPLPTALGWKPRTLTEALTATPAAAMDRGDARLFFLKPALRIGLGVLWAWTGIVSAFVNPLVKSEAMVAGLGVTGRAATATVYAGAALDLVLGTALLFGVRVAAVGKLQVAVMLLFTVLATIAVPDQWAEPFGPLIKNIAVLLATLVMIAMEDET